MTATANTTAPVSKKSIAAAVYAEMTAAGKTRKDILFTIVDRAGLSEAGAATYFNNFRKGLWKIEGVEPAAAPAAEVIDFASKTSKELVELYNARAEKPVTKFRDHATAVTRVTALYAQ